MTLRAPLITPQPTRVGAAAPVLGSSMALLTAVAAAAAPFLNIDWSDPKFAPATAWQSLGSPLVLLTTGAPFAQLDWSPPKRPAPIAAPDQLHLAITEFANLAPFVPDMSDGPCRAPNFLPTPQPYNLALLSGATQAPFAQFIWPNTTQVPGLAPPQPTRNTNIFSEVPFSKLDWPSTFGAPDFAPPAPLPLNLELFTNPIPFPAPDMSAGPWRASRFPPPAQPYDLALLNGPVAPTPFAKTDWQPAWRPYLLAPQQQSLNLALLNLNPIPFAQYSWPPANAVRAAGFPAQPPGISSLLSAPFNQADWSRPQRLPAATPIPAPYNAALYSATASAPFVQADWSRPFFPRTSPAPAPAPNMNFYPNPIPFVSTDRPRVVRAPLVGPPQLLPLNVNLFTNPIPFNQLDWGTRFAPKPAPPQPPGNARASSARFVTFLSATTVTATLSTTGISAMMASSTGIVAASSTTTVT